MYLIDTNIFLEILLDQERGKECEKFLMKVENGEISAVVTSFSLHSIAVILERLKNINAYEEFLKVILNLEGLVVYSTNPGDEIEVCKIAKKFNLTFDDALQYYVADLFKLKLVSFDSDFDETDMKRISSEEV